MPKITCFGFITLFLLSCWLIKGIYFGKLRICRTPLDIPILFFLVLGAISTAFSIHFLTSLFGTYERFEGLITFFYYVLLYFLATQYFSDRKKIDFFLDVMLIVALGVSLGGILQAVAFSKTRISASFANPVFLATYLQMMLLLSLSKFVESSGGSKSQIYALSSFLILTCFLLTYTRASWIALVAALFLFFALLGGKIPKVKFTAILGVFAVAALGITLIGLLMGRPGGISYMVHPLEYLP